ncbi:hypothetical protein FRACYDRAFT_254378 [Fragilariopsis cylindrus CCMP1102]|uniref:Uncharacterized protein n=1 Tax=Fragilariopsis cylindrus CCMP1102 TaxID=635003 RepID=A0A1E7EKU7_9STRA|nr:hypothetical protein FRACYDRAFT_254378 [Fragilariopsis cylindrus CCMP1102]|eukprot:OEU06549.1 hypothetical protein FRACYDRAFT_254378 [Fragilariopsis cylindrus CCMP1102]
MWMLVYLTHLVLLYVIFSRGKHNVPVHYVDVSAPESSGIVLCNPVRTKKVMGGKHNVLVHFLNVCAPKSSGIVLCNPVRNGKDVGGKHNVLVHYVDDCAPNLSGRLEHRIDSLSSLGHITCEWKASSSQPTNILDVIAAYPCFQKYLIKSNQGPYLK